MIIKVNGREKEYQAETITLIELLASMQITPESGGVAVAVNWSVIPKPEWPSLPLRHNDEIEIITARQGG